ncbi:MFS transporter [Candidatus Woesearchaeota archaeon]|nr:MFS transporter [Candidatus Woesearchaeota archaeon]
MDIKRNIRLLFLHRFFGMGLFFVPIGILFLLENGLSNFQVLFIAGFFAFMNVIFEVPSGIFADKYGRKTAIVVSNIAFMVASLTYALGHEFSTFLIGELFFAVGVSFMSGADSAFIYDTLKQIKKEKKFKKTYGNYQLVTFVSLGIYSLFGGFIATIDLRLAFWFSMIPTGIAIMISSLLKEPKFTKSAATNYWDHLKDASSYLKTHQGIRFMIVYFMIMYAVLESMWILNQPYLNSLNISLEYFGVIFFVILIASGLISKYAYKLENLFGLRKLLILMIFVPMIAYILMASLNFMWLAILIIIPSSIWSINMVITDSYLNRLVKSGHRATLISMKNLSGQLMFSIYSPVLGYIIDAWSLKTAIALSATILFLDLIVLSYFLQLRKKDL